MEILTKENPMKQILFNSVGVRAVLKILVSIKNLRQDKKFPWDKFVNKKEHFAKHFTMHKISVDFLELSMFIYYLMKWIGDFNMEKKIC